MADVVIQAQSTLYNRQGSTFQYKRYSLPEVLIPYITTAYGTSGIPGSLTSNEQELLQDLLTQDSQIIPGGLTLYNILALDPTLYPGAADLQALYQLNPFGSEYETETEDLYERSYLVARAAAVSGPTNVRGGTARQGFELAELDTLQSINRFREVWQAQMATAQLTVSAAQVANAAESARINAQLRAQQQQAGTEQGRVMQSLGAAEQLSRDRSEHLRALGAGAEFTGVPYMETKDSYQGEGFQGGATTSFGMSYWR